MLLTDYIGKTIRISYDNGKTWQFYEVLKTDDWNGTIVCKDFEDEPEEVTLQVAKPLSKDKSWSRLSAPLIKIVNIPEGKYGE